MSHEPVVIRLYLGWGAELWHGGPITASDTGLSTEVLVELDAWATECYRRINEHINGGAPADAHFELLPRGVEIARQIAAQLGHRFSVEVDDVAGDEKLLIHSDDPPTNPVAAVSMARVVEVVARRQREQGRVVDEALARGEVLRWRPSRPSAQAD